MWPLEGVFMIMAYLKKVSPVSFCIVLFLATILMMPFGEPVIKSVQAGSYWIETTEADFTAGIAENVTVTPDGNLTIPFSVQSIEDDFLDQTKITSTDNLIVDTILGNVKLKSQPNEINQTYGGIDIDLGWDVVPTDDGGFIIAAASVSYGPGFYDAWQIKTDSMGSVEWDKTFGGTEKDGARSIALTNDGGYMLGGYADSYGNPGHDFWLLKTNSTGAEEWNHTYGGTGTDASWKPFSTHQTSDDGYVICGYETSFGSDGSYDAWVVKTDSMGIEQWNRTFGGLGSENGNGIQETKDGGFILVGETTTYGGGGTDLWLIKMNSTGDEEWNKTFGGLPDDWGGSVYQTEDGGFIVTGDTKTYTSGGFDFWLIKTDSDGNEEWNNTFGRSNADDTGHSVKPTSDGGYIILGVSTVFSSDTDIWLIKTDDMGNEEWNRYFGGPGEDWAFSISETPDGAYVMVGDTSSYGPGSNDVWLLKYAPPVSPYGELYSTNLLSSMSVSSIDSFSATTSIPVNSELRLQFSQDNFNWYNSMGILGAWDFLLDGPNNIDLSPLGWSDSNLYYRMNFSTQTSEIPVLDYVNVTYSGIVSLGVFTSQAFDCGSTNVIWKTLSWIEPIVPGADVLFHLKTADIQGNLSLKGFIGPDGTSGTFYSFSPLGISSVHDGEPWIQYRAYLSTTGMNPPVLEEVSIYYNFMPEVMDLILPLDDVWIEDTTPFFNWTSADSDGILLGFQVIIDNDVGFLSVDYNSGMQSTSDDYWQFPNGTGYTQITEGVWYWKVRVQDDDGDWSLFSPHNIMKIDSAGPVSTITSPVNSSHLKDLTVISGTASDSGGTGVANVSISIRRDFDNQFWDGAFWIPSDVWLPTTGNTTWTKTTGLPVWDSGKNYTIRSKAMDNAGKMEVPDSGVTFFYDTNIPWSTITEPSDGSYHNNMIMIYGSSSDLNGGIVDVVEVSIRRFVDSQYWDGFSWTGSEVWLNASGTLSWSLSSMLPAWEHDLIYIIRSRATDKALNTESPGFGNAFTFDTVAPEPPFQVTATPDWWTNNNSFDLDWDNPSDTSGVMPGAYYKLHDPPTSASDGIWLGEKPLTNLTVADQGAHVIYIWLMDTVGNTNYLNYSSTTLYFDSEIAEPKNVTANPEGWSKSNSFNIDWVEPSDTSGFSGAYYRFDSPPVSETDGIWAPTKPILGVSAPDEGSHTIYIWLLDNAGNIDFLSYGTTTLNFDTQDPAPPIDIAAVPGAWSNVNSFDINWINPNDTSGFAGAYYRFGSPPSNDIDGVYVLGDEIQSLNDIQVSDEGDHVIYVWLRDRAGNINYLNYSTTTLYFDSVINEPENIEVHPPGWSNTHSFNVSWTNPLETSRISGAYYRLDLQPTSDTDGNYVTGEDLQSLTGISVSGEGEHTVYIWLVDAAGNVDFRRSSTATIHFDSSNPGHPLNVTVDPDWSLENSFSIDWEFPEIEDISGIKIGAWYKIGSPPVSNDDGTWVGEKPLSLTSSELGAVNVYIWLEDNAGNSNYLDYETVQLRWDNVIPLLSIMSPTKDEWFAQREVDLKWNATDSNSHISNYMVRVDNGPYTDLGNVVSYTVTGLSDGKHKVYLRAYDAAGNQNETTVTFFVDTLMPSVTITEPQNNDSFDTDSITISWWGVDSGSIINNYAIKLDDGSFVDLGSIKNHTLSNLTHGTHTVYVRGYDNAGNFGESIITINVILYLVPDTDGDGLNDTVDPDDDNDGLPDEWEEGHGLDRLDAGDAHVDSDGDGLNNTHEFEIGTDPQDMDTDSDGHNDKDDYYPLDSEKWEKEDASSGFPVVIIILVIVIIAVLLLLLQMMKRKQDFAEEDEYEDLLDVDVVGDEEPLEKGLKDEDESIGEPDGGEETLEKESEVEDHFEDESGEEEEPIEDESKEEGESFEGGSKENEEPHEDGIEGEEEPLENEKGEEDTE
jgi:hypothetical protein